MLLSERSEYTRQQRLTALAVAQALRVAPRGPRYVAQTIQTYQAAAIQLSMETLGALLAEQGISQAAQAAVTPATLITGTPELVGMLNKTTHVAGFVQTFVRDAGRTARAVDIATRPAVTGFVRSLVPPSCGRCAILAGRVYRYSEGFLRHPGCDCLMTPVNDFTGPIGVTDPMELFDKGQITDLSAADIEAVNAGADLAQVVNVRRRRAGLTVSGSVVNRGRRLTPQGCLTTGRNREEQLQLLRDNRYIH